MQERRDFFSYQGLEICPRPPGRGQELVCSGKSFDSAEDDFAQDFCVVGAAQAHCTLHHGEQIVGPVINLAHEQPETVLALSPIRNVHYDTQGAARCPISIDDGTPLGV